MSQATVTPAVVPTQSSPVTPPPRMVTVLVSGVAIHVPCPSWCKVADHATDDLVDLVDLRHQGESVPLAVPGFGGRETAMSVQLTSYPFDPDLSEREPHLQMTVPSGDCVSLPAALAESVAAGLERHAAMMRALTGQLAGV